jgi:uncharacterized protein (TIGR02145 family)
MTKKTILAVHWHSIHTKIQYHFIALALTILCILVHISFAQDLCAGFTEGEEREHQGKSKAQFCDPRDGTKYVYVDIGKQTWMAENLRYSAEGTMGRCAQNKDENCDTYGRLYTLDEMFCKDGCAEEQWGVADPNEHAINIACPAGWHLPSTTELEELLTYADPNFVAGTEAMGTGKNVAGIKLKAKSWGTGANIGTDDYGFSGLPGGYCGSGCTNVATGTQQFGNMSFWWSHAYGAPVPLAKSWSMTTTAVVNDAYQSYSTSAFYTRCLKNKTPSPKTPESSPQAIACNGSGGEGQNCHYGQWKDYFIDSRDGKQYPYVKIGDSYWMAANLNFATSSGSVCYNDFDANCNIYGRLYNWQTTMGLTGKENATLTQTGLPICPAGLRLPTNAEWTALTTAIGGLTGTAEKLKAKSGWVSNGTDDYGFAALPGSYGNLSTGNYTDLSQAVTEFGSARGGFWWSSTKQAANGAVIRHIGPTSANITSVDNDVSRLYSVRCISSGTATFIPKKIDSVYAPGLKLSNLTLPDGYTWVAPNTVLSGGENQSFLATYTDGNLIPATGSIAVNVAKADGAQVDTPIEASKTHNSISIIAITASTGQTVEYGISTAHADATTTWQTSLTFASLLPETDYCIFARAVANENYNAVVSSSLCIKTNSEPSGSSIPNSPPVGNQSSSGTIVAASNPSSSSVGKTTINLPQIVSGSIGIHIAANTILLSNLPSNAKVEVYNLQGKRIYSANSENFKTLQIQVKTGMYIVKAGSQTIRTVVR